MEKPAKVKEAHATTTETSITLSWDAVECDHYSLHLEEIADHASQNKLHEPIKVDKSQEMPYEIIDLKPGTPYTIGIEANFNGKNSEKTCITVVTKPEAPTDPEVKVNDTEALLKWSGPKFPAHSVVYEVEFVNAEGEMFNGRPFHCKEPHCEVDGLQESYQYDVTVYTVVQYQQNEGRSKPLKTTVKTPLHGVDFRVVAKTERSITVHWTTEQHVPSTPPLQYVTFIRIGDTVRCYKKHGAEDNERTFENLDMGTKYTVGVCKGSGDDWSDPKEEDETTGKKFKK
ncbi:tenascin-like [Branchiostoma floridae x Branchiostoma belcheri]